MSGHKFKPETTNGGCCFADCSCGWSGGVYENRAVAKIAWEAHRDGGTPPVPLRPQFLVGARAHGMEVDDESR